MVDYSERLEANQWAQDEFGHVDFGDVRRTNRLISLATCVALTPGGRVSDVTKSAARQQGAYDFLESSLVSPAAILVAVAIACVARTEGLPFVFQIIDGSSLRLMDTKGKKGLGSIGSRRQKARGLKVISSMSVDPDGVPLGLAGQTWWARGARKMSASRRVAKDKETQYWLDTIKETTETYRTYSPDTKLCFLIDREGDSRLVLNELIETGHWFTVRSCHDRAVFGDKNRLRQSLEASKPLGEYWLDVPAGPKRTARHAKMVVRAIRVELRIRDKRSGKKSTIVLNAVLAKEKGTVPKGEKAIDWCLLTNLPIDSFEQVCEIVKGYTRRWRIEDFHKAWKSGVCRVEETQLRSRPAIIKWATILAANAMRAERIKHLARTEPKLPASALLNEYEIKALIMLKRASKKQTEQVPNKMPTIAQATIWIAELGGYTGKSSGGPPGTITIGRGLETILPAARILEIQAAEKAAKKAEKMPQKVG